MAVHPNFKGYEPKNLAEIEDSTDTKDYANFVDVRVKPLFFHDPAEDLMTDSQDLDPDDEQILAQLASSLCLHKQEAGAERLQICHSKKNLQRTKAVGNHFGQHGIACCRGW